MPTIPFDVFRFRSKKTTTIPLPLAEDDTDRSSSPEHLPHKMVDRLVRGRKASASVSRPSDEKDAVRYADPACLPNTPSSSGKQPSNAAPDAKVTLIRRVTSKLHIAIPKSSASDSRPADSRRPRNQTSRLFVSPTSPLLPNSFVSREHREAALRERGLLPPKKDLSQQERDEDARLPVVPLRPTTEASPETDGRAEGMMSLAEKIKQEWMSLNHDKVAQASESEPDSSNCSLPPYSPGGVHSPSVALQEQDAHETRSPGQAPSPLQTQVPLPASPPPVEPLSVPDARLSFSSSLPRLSTSLEVLPEEQENEGPSTPPPSAPPPRVYIHGQTVTSPGIVVSTAVEACSGKDAEESPTQTMVESPVSGAPPSLLHPHILDTCVEEPDDADSPTESLSNPLPPRRNTSDTYERGRGTKRQRPTISTRSLLSTAASTRSPSLSPTMTAPVSRSHSRLGKVSSFTNLRRTVSTSFRSIRTSSYRSATPSSDTASGMTEMTLRTPISPTMHNNASICSEMHAVEDPESRRLCEMAFLD
ncbi:hypothetical protein EDC04DRAFT_3088267 [Pisolithus marmoratus]|nr:hypothetical protein EDC04DRAFT_3088267 [Pisolithus marmoratus]